MNKNIISLFGFVLCSLLIIISGFLFFATEGTDAEKMKIIYVGFILLILHGCYRIYKFKTSTHKNTETDEVQKNYNRQILMLNFSVTSFILKKCISVLHFPFSLFWCVECLVLRLCFGHSHFYF